MKIKSTILATALLSICTIGLAHAQADADKRRQDSIRHAEYENRFHNDFANLERYKADNASVGLPKAGENRVVFMGNSITEGWGNSDPDFFKGKPYVNRGISGQTTPQMLLRFRPDVINLKPKVVVILAGTNDIAGNTGPTSEETIVGNIQSMALLAQHYGIKVVISSILPVYDYPWKRGLNPVPKIASINKSLKEFAESNKMIYLDYYSAMADEKKGMKADLSKDGVHPTIEGYKVMEPMVEAAIAKALKSK